MFFSLFFNLVKKKEKKQEAEGSFRVVVVKNIKDKTSVSLRFSLSQHSTPSPNFFSLIYLLDKFFVSLVGLSLLNSNKINKYNYYLFSL